jgi:hypothetical protein
MKSFFNQKPEGFGEVAKAPKLSKAKSAAAAKKLAEENPNRVRINAKIQEFKQKLSEK